MKSTNPLRQKGLTVPSRGGYVAMLVLSSLVVYGVLATPVRAAGTPEDASADRALCQFQAPLANPVDPCPLLEQANALVPRLTQSAAQYARKVASGFDPERSLRIQQALLREDLTWMSRGFSRRQLDLMVFVSVALSLEQADALSVELRRSFAANGDPNDHVRLQRIDLYQSQALDLLEELSASLRTVPDSELRFYF